MFRVVYSREYDLPWFRVSASVIGQTILVHQNVLISVLGMDSRCSLGCKDITIHEIIELGFLIPRRDAKLVI